MKFVSVIMGSSSDKAIMQHCVDTLTKLNVPYEWLISSAHRTPERTHAYVRDAESKGAQVFICAAGMAAHLAGAVSANTTKPVIGVPLSGGAMDGLDALLSTVQMPAGMPVATVAIGKAGAVNAAYMAAQILSLGDPKIAEAIKADRQAKADKVVSDSQEFEVRLV